MKPFRIIPLCLVFWFVPAVATAAVELTRIVAVVNDEVITSFELNNAFAPLEKRIEATYKGNDKERLIKETRMGLLRKMIDKVLLEQEGRKTGIVVTDAEITAAIRDIVARQNITMDDLSKALANEGMTLAEYRNDIRDQMIRMRVLRRDVRSKITISEEEIGEYYLKHREEYEGKEAVRIKQILLLYAPDMDEVGKNDLKEKMETIRKRIMAGESFDLLAANYSQGPAADQGGDVGFVEKGMMLPEVDRVAFGLGKDEVSPVISSSVGVHLVKIIDKRGAGVKPIEAVREEIVSRIEEGKLEKKYEGWMEELRQRSHIEIRI